jgi:hypothetical protein
MHRSAGGPSRTTSPKEVTKVPATSRRSCQSAGRQRCREDRALLNEPIEKLALPCPCLIARLCRPVACRRGSPAGDGPRQPDPDWAGSEQIRADALVRGDAAERQVRMAQPSSMPPPGQHRPKRRRAASRPCTESTRYSAWIKSGSPCPPRLRSLPTSSNTCSSCSSHQRGVGTLGSRHRDHQPPGLRPDRRRRHVLPGL